MYRTNATDVGIPVKKLIFTHPILNSIIVDNDPNILVFTIDPGKLDRCSPTLYDVS
jgi:hypothetical protein